MHSVHMFLHSFAKIFAHIKGTALALHEVDDALHLTIGKVFQTERLPIWQCQ